MPCLASVTVCNKRVALLFKVEAKEQPFLLFAFGLLLALELEVPLVLVVEVIF
jgi:hypothetical protein